jgi:hypothetical protein
MKKLVFIFFVLVLFSQCRNDETVFFSSFKNEEKLIGKPIDWLDNNQAWDFFILDSLLLIADDEDEFFISIYDLNRKQLLCELFRKGKGPNELFYQPELVCEAPQGLAADKIVVDDRGREERLILDIKGSISAKKPVIAKKYHIPNLFIDGHYVNDSIIIKSFYGENGYRLKYYNLENSQELDKPNHLNSIENKFVRKYGWSAKMTKIIPSPDKNYLVGLFYHHKRIYLYSIEGKLLKIFQDKKSYGTMFSQSIHSAPDLDQLPILFSNCLLSKDYMIVICENRLSGGTGLTSLYVFDYLGNPLYKYDLDRHIYSECFFNWSSATLYAFDIYNFEIVSYYLDGLKRNN